MSHKSKSKTRKADSEQCTSVKHSDVLRFLFSYREWSLFYFRARYIKPWNFLSELKIDDIAAIIIFFRDAIFISLGVEYFEYS